MRLLVAALTDHVSVVLRSCAEEQVIGIHAGWEVALVQHAESFGDQSPMQCPRESVREHASGADAEGSVAVIVLQPDPLPAVVGLVDPPPEPFGRVLSETTRPRAEAVRSITSAWYEGLIAGFAESRRITQGHQGPLFLAVQGGRGRLDPSSDSAYSTAA